MMMCMFFMFSLLIICYDYVFIYFGSFYMIFLFFCYYMGFFDGVFFFDYLSLLLGVMSVIIFLVSIMMLDNSFNSVLIFWFMMFFVFLSFFSCSSFIFYLSFEFSFVLIFFFLLSWGNAMERYQASFYMFFYTLLFSLPFFILMVDFFLNYSTFFIIFSFLFYFDVFWYFFFLVFLVKLPIIVFHLWLPKAHVEAPLSGSMVLAGVLLKLGGYGVIRFLYLLNYLSFSSSYMIIFFFYISTYGGLLLSIMCLRQVDLKMLIAYSSVVHMSVMLMGLLSFSIYGLYGSILMLVGHGFVSSLMFFLMTIFYYLLHSRSIMVLKGGVLLSPIFCLFWFLSCTLNIGLPPFMTFFSEICILGSMSFLGFIEWFIMMISCLFVGMYCIYSYIFMSHGSMIMPFLLILNNKHFFILFIHLFIVFIYTFLFFLM